VQDVSLFPEFVAEVGSTLEESGAVRESASDEVRKARGRVRTLEGRIRGMLKVGGDGASACEREREGERTRRRRERRGGRGRGRGRGGRCPSMLMYAHKFDCARASASHLPRVSSQQGYQGEATELGGRLCVAVPASPDGMPKGILLGSGPGGSVW
jgi:hypothetical protein